MTVSVRTYFLTNQRMLTCWNCQWIRRFCVINQRHDSFSVK
jgi:hypothetical protein